MKANLEVDLLVGLRPGGIETSLFIGDGDTPFESEFDFEEMIETFIGYYTVRDLIPERHVDEIHDVIDMLYDAAAKLEHRLSEDIIKQQQNDLFE